MTDDNLRRNQFWHISQQELSRHGYVEFHAELNRDVYDLVIKGVTANGVPASQKYFFPRRVRNDNNHTLQNYRSKLKRFIREELPGRNFYPPADHRQRQPGRSILKLNGEEEKKPLAIPNTIKKEFAKEEVKFEEIFAPPVIPDQLPPAAPVAAPAPVEAKKAITEPMSKTKVLAVFLMDKKDLPTVMDTLEGVAIFRGSKPAPIRITGEDHEPVYVPPPPAPEPQKVVFSQPTPTHIVVQQRKIGPRPAISYKQQLINRMSADLRRVWTLDDLQDIVAKRSSLGGFMTLLSQEGYVERVGLGRYKAVRRKAN